MADKGLLESTSDASTALFASPRGGLRAETRFQTRARLDAATSIIHSQRAHPLQPLLKPAASVHRNKSCHKPSGAARAIAARVIQRDSLAKQWDEDVKQALAKGQGPDDFLKAGDVLSADSGALSYGFMKGLVGLGFMMWGALSQGREHRVLRDDARRGFAVLPPRLEQSGNSPHSAASPEFSG